MSEAISIEDQKDTATEVFAKEGYKQTKLGWIPENWDLTSLNKVSQIKGDYGINAAAVEFSPKLPTYLRITDIDKDGNFLEDGKKSVDDSQSGNFILKEGDVVFARTGASVGKTYFHHKKNGKLIFAGFLIRFRTKISLLLPKYLFYYTHSNLYWNWVKVNSMRSGQPGINSKEYGNLPFPLPPLPEQEKIAAILSTWDIAIGKQEQLIAAKQLYKKGLMQLLLTGKKRFDRFEGEWIESKLGNYCNVLMCKRIFNSETSEIGEIPFYKIGTVCKKPDAFISRKLFQEYKKKYNYPRLHEILITCSGTVGKCIPYNGEEAYFQDSNIVWIDNPKNEIDNKFLYYIISTYDWNKLNSTTITRIYTNDLKSMRISFPSFKEQQKIASVLSNADKEISILQNQLTQLQTQKRGLLQKLLTGAVRVKI